MNQKSPRGMIDALGRRVGSSEAGVVSVSHYSDGSDSPGWVTQTGGPDVVSGLASASVQLVDVRGNTVTSFDVGSKTVSGWGCFDAFGNPETQVDRSGLLGYGAYGQMQRSTSSSGLLLMGVRVYNPVTNQFTSVDAVVGGNETPYGYPNDPVNKNDFSGLWMAVNDAIDLIEIALTVAFCFILSAIGCFIANMLAGAISSAVKKTYALARSGASVAAILQGATRGFFDGLRDSAIGFFVGNRVINWLMKSSFIRKQVNNAFREIVLDVFVGYGVNKGVSAIFDYKPSTAPLTVIAPAPNYVRRPSVFV